ncbi:MAG: carboxyltransferase subunit alpha, partial [Sciscionella sp.]
AAERVAQLLDPGSAIPVRPRVDSVDVLNFVDTRPYSARLAEARAETGMDEAVTVVCGRIAGNELVLAAMDFRFLGGSLGCAAGELITIAAETALAERVPLLIVTASGGARMQEGALSLMQMAKTSAALAQLDEAGVLTVSLISDPTFGGVAASFATLCDVVIAEPGARLGFAGRRVVEQTIKQTLPKDFQTAEFLLRRGLIDLIVPRQRLRAELATLLAAAGRPTLRERSTAQVIRDPGRLPERDPLRQVRRARRIDRPTTLDYIAMICQQFVELHGDRVSGDCPAVVAGLARLGGVPIAVVGHQKGHTAQELNERDFGMSSPAGYRKAGRVMRLAAKLGLPVITLVDTPGAYPGATAEEHGQAMAIAESLRLMASLPVPVVAVVTGEGGSGGALALAVANRVLMYANSVYSVISPEGCAAILWQDCSATDKAAGALRLTARDLLALRVVDGVLPEPDGDTGGDPRFAAELLRAGLLSALDELAGLGPSELVADRRSRFRQYGTEHRVVVELATIGEAAR